VWGSRSCSATPRFALAGCGGYFLAGEQLTRPKLEFTEKVLPDALYFAQPAPSMQNVWLVQSMENALDSKSKAQPVFEVAARTRLSVLPLTMQLSRALLQIGQANCAAPPPPDAPPVPSLSTTPPHEQTHATAHSTTASPEIRQTTAQR
jgi:hypothetical protein